MLTHLLLTAVASAAPGADAAPQGSPDHRRALLESDGLGFPIDPRPLRFDPFAAVPSRNLGIPILASGLADLDGDGNRDAWFLGQAPAGGPVLALAQARTWVLGSFRPLPGAHLVYGSFTAAATWHTKALGCDAILLADPLRPDLELLLQPAAGDPRQNARLRLSAWVTGTGVRAVAAADHEQDGHDDVWLLQDDGASWRVRKLRMQDSNGLPMLGSSSELQLPSPAARLCVLDWDGDRRSDAAFEFPGLGVMVVGDQSGVLTMLDFLPTIGMTAVSIDACDRDRDGREDLLLGYSAGAVLWRSLPVAVAIPLGNPTLAPALAGAVFADGNGDGTDDVVGYGVDGQTLVVHAFGPTGTTSLAPVLRQPDAAGRPHYQGTAPLGQAVLVGDLDSDGDGDLLVQLAGACHWLALAQTQSSSQPTDCPVRHGGPIGETGFLLETVQLSLPQSLLAAGVRDAELIVFLRAKGTPQFVYWGRLLRPVDPATGRADFSVYLLADPKQQAQLIQGNNPYALPGGITAGGETLLSVHAKVGPKRFGASLLHHDPGGDGNKSGIGVKWDLSAAPPAPGTNDDPLPWD